MADTRSLQRKVNRFSQFEAFVKGNVSEEPIERIKAQIKLLTEEWDDYKSNEKNFRDLPENIELQDAIETKYFSIKDSSLQELVANQRSFLNEVSKINNKNDSDVRLPRVNVMTFSGVYSEFASFRDLFEASINSNPKISKVHKLQYLKGLLRGEAAALVRHIMITEGNYDEAWEIIKNRYDKKKPVVAMLLKQFMDQPTIKQASAKSLHHMRDISDEALRGLKVLDKQAESRDPWLIHILVSKLDQTTKHYWAQHSYGIDFPTINNYFDFLTKQSETLESCQPTRHIAHPQVQNPNVKVMHVDTQSVSCFKCGGNHYLRNCEQFQNLSVHNRRSFIAENKLCFICMFKNHQSQRCRSKYRCGICRAKHHTTLHQDDKSISTQATALTTEIEPNNSAVNEENAEQIKIVGSISIKRYTAILPTAVIRVRDSSNKYQMCRALLDSGAQASFISEACAKRLALPRAHARILLKSITPGTEVTKGKLTIKAVSMYSDKDEIKLDVFILKKLTDCLPSREISDLNFKRIKELELADPHLYNPAKVDIIIGADRFFSVLRGGFINNLTDSLVAQNSVFGWIVSGEVIDGKNSAGSTRLNYHIELNVDETLRKFWEIEEMPSSTVQRLSQEESECEEHFKNNLMRSKGGKYIVKLPFKTSRITLGNSLCSARKRFFHLEAKLSRDTKLKGEYIQIMREYLTLGHMREIPPDQQNQPEDRCFYLPHHAVIKNESSSTKLRVVFDGSSKTTKGNSINDQLMVGPTIQLNLWTTLINFQYNKIALTADIVKMYRQVAIAEEDQEFQRILWRENSSKTLKHYQLTTVTFGMASSAFLAIRCLHQTALEFKEEYPEIAREITTKFYVDDYLSGANTIEEATLLKEKLSLVIKRRGFYLTKWRSNVAELFDPLTEREESLLPIEEANVAAKILGMQWNSKNDSLSFKVSTPIEERPTKRTLISNASKIFDPLGLVSPTIIIAKILYQKLWLRKIGWDDELPDDIVVVWNQLKAELHQLEKIKINRFINSNQMQIHGFSDASERAYSAVVYGRFKNENGCMQTELIASKTKVAPIRQVSLPRLELCGAHLLAKLITQIRKTLHENVTIHAWTDSTIVLAWLSDHPIKWKTFIANRVSEIQMLLPRNHWSHVHSEENPADYASRGVLPSKLLTLHQWWHGPPWLVDPEALWPVTKSEVFYDDTICEARNKAAFIPIFNIPEPDISEIQICDIILNKTFSFTKAIRILCFVHRFIRNARAKQNERLISVINLSEIKMATEKLISWVQQRAYSNEIRLLAKGQQLHQHHKLSALTPFLDTNGLLRVGGRLNNSNFPYDCKHPIILPKSHSISRMIILFYHRKYLHPGPSHTSNLIRQTYWIVNGRSVIRDVVQKCVQCFKTRATHAKQLMGDLPSVRTTPARPFANCGIDYAGPIILASKRGRGAKMIKGYIALFVCMVTKAVHLEAVTELTTDAFLAALKRFSSRRNFPSNIYTDNGTNFVGANKYLKEVNRINKINNNNTAISDFCTQNNVYWHHIPPSAPHFGGLWESAVKSVKTHIHRVAGNVHLTFEEMATLLCQIEGILNSRPLCPISQDDDSFEALTPAHFLTGSSLASVPDYEFGDANTSRLSRWQQIQQRTQYFWKRFHKDYLNNLQQRSKWQTKQENIKIGDLVLIRDDNLPSLKWPMGRVIENHQDDHGIVRVVTIKTCVRRATLEFENDVKS